MLMYSLGYSYAIVPLILDAETETLKYVLWMLTLYLCASFVDTNNVIILVRLAISLF